MLLPPRPLPTGPTDVFCFDRRRGRGHKPPFEAETKNKKKKKKKTRRKDWKNNSSTKKINDDDDDDDDDDNSSTARRTKYPNEKLSLVARSRRDAAASSWRWR